MPTRKSGLFVGKSGWPEWRADGRVGFYMNPDQTLRLPSITIRQLRANLTESGARSAIDLLSRFGTDGLLVVENRELLSPNKGRKSVLAYGPGFPNRPDIVAAVKECDGRTEVPLAIISAVRLATESEVVAEIRREQ